jgi:dienelactone hydrolase
VPEPAAARRACGGRLPLAAVRRTGTAALCGLAAALALLASGCGGAGSSRAAPPRAPSPFADRRAPLRVASRRVATGNGRVRVRDVSFAGRRGRVEAYLAAPAGPRGRLAAVILLHGAGGTRDDFLPYAIRLAGRGLVGLTLTAPSSSAPAAVQGAGPRATLRRQEQLSIDDVVAVRRAVDFLETVPSVDRRRIGVVGWSLGARTGAVVSGVEPRVRAFALLSAGALPVSDYAKAAPAWLRPDIRAALGTIDPLRWIARARPGSLLLEDGLHDEVVPRRALLAVVHAAPRGTRVRWYDAGHRLDRKAVADQLTWLVQKLGAGA